MAVLADYSWSHRGQQGLSTGLQVNMAGRQTGMEVIYSNCDKENDSRGRDGWWRQERQQAAEA